MSGRERTAKVTRSAVGWLLKKGYSCHTELGVMPWGRRRADVVALNLKRHIIIVEVKQSWQDLKQDAKFDQYLQFCNKMYFGLPHDLFESREDQIRQHIDVRFGILVLEESGLARVRRPAPDRGIKGTDKRNIITRLAWRGGTSKRNSRRNRVYL